jgi:hypothetical protein
MAKRVKKTIEVLLVKTDLGDLPLFRQPKSRCLVTADIIWPRSGIARKSAAREATLKKGVADFSRDKWAQRILFREDVEEHCAFAVSVTEPVTVQKIKRFARLTAKYALRMGADFMEKAMVGYADVASAPLDALSAMVGEKDAPKAIAQGLADLPRLPGDNEEIYVDIPLLRPGTAKTAGTFTLALRG